MPSATSAMPSSITSKLRPLDLGGAVVGVRFLGQIAAFATGRGEIVLVGECEQKVSAHKGAVLSFAGDARRVITGGDDGRVVAT